MVFGLIQSAVIFKEDIFPAENNPYFYPLQNFNQNHCV